MDRLADSRGERANSPPTGSHTFADKNVPEASSVVMEQWYFRIDGKNYGPTSRDALERFLSPPRLCKSVQVMCSVFDGQWLLVHSNETVEEVLHKFGLVTDPPIEEPDAEPVAPSRVVEMVRSATTAAFETVWKYKFVIFLLVVVAAVNLLFLYLFVDEDDRNQKITAKFQSIWDTVQKSKSRETSDDEWQTFAEESRMELEPIIDELARSATVQKPVRQQLLFLGRDHLKPLLASETAPMVDAPSRRAIETYFKLIQPTTNSSVQALGANATSPRNSLGNPKIDPSRPRINQ